jgi:dTDP-4-dehydrorhamnose reductase
MRILVTGSGGMVGRALVQYCERLGDNVLAYEHKRLAIEDPAAVRETLEREGPETVINCAAWTDVDGCEEDPQTAHEANARGPENLAVGSRGVGASFIHISTDFVFDGAKEGFYTQRDDPNPQSHYGRAKLDGERLAQNASARTIIVRSGWIFGPGGKNFLSRVVELTKEGKSLKAITDAYGTPTYARDLAARLRELAVLDLPGIYHVVNEGEGASFDEFARSALGIAGLDASSLESASMDSLQRPAPRPRNSRLRCLLSNAIGLEPLPHWQDALRDFITREAVSKDEDESNASSSPDSLI